MTTGKLMVQDTIVSFTRIEQGDFLSLTDIARVKNPAEPKDVVKNWLRSRSTLEFLGLWERINNPSFKGVEFDSFKNEAGTNSFTLSPSKWIETTGAIGIRSASGRAGGTSSASPADRVELRTMRDHMTARGPDGHAVFSAIALLQLESKPEDGERSD